MNWVGQGTRLTWIMNINVCYTVIATRSPFFIKVILLVNPCCRIYENFLKGFRRNSGTYESTYLFAKFSTLFIVAVIDANNCIFRSFPQSHLAIARQVLLLVSTMYFFGLQCYFAPFMDPVGNASEWISRLNYVTTAGVALAIALNVPGQDIINGPILYTSVPFLRCDIEILILTPESME
jgi:hypothetical protein